MTSAANPYQLKTCPECLRRYMNWGAHAEECPGPRQRISQPPTPDPGSECGCNSGGMHDPTCVHVTGEPA